MLEKDSFRITGYTKPIPGQKSGSRTVEPDGIPEFGDIVSGAFSPVLAKHSKSFIRIDPLAVGVDQIQCNFEPMQSQVEGWWQTGPVQDLLQMRCRGPV